MAKGSGVDIGTASAKLLAGELKGSTFVVHSFVLADNEDGSIGGGWEALAGTKPGAVRVGVNGRDLNVRYTRVPRLPDWQLRRLMRFETDEIGGQSDSEVASDFNVLPEMPEIEGEDVVLLALARETLLEEHLVGLKRARAKLEAFTPNALGLYNAFLRYGVIEDETVLLADIGHESLNVVLVRGADLVFARNLMGGSRLFDKALAERFGIDEARARAFKMSEGTLETSRAFKDPNQEKGARTLAAPAGQILSLLQSAVVFAKSQVKISSLKLDRVLLCGGGARLAGLTAYLSRGMSVPVELFDPFRVVDLSKLDPESAERLEAHKLEAVTALGLATAAADPDAYGIEILPARVRKSREFLGGTLFLIAAAALALAFLGLRAWRYQDVLAGLELERDRLTREYQRVERTNRETLRLLEENEALAENAGQLFALAGAGEQVARTLDALERDLPADFWVDTLAMDWQSDPDLGVARGEERPILRVRGRSREGTESPALLFQDFAAALRKRVPEARTKERMGESDFTIDLCALGVPAAAPLKETP
ncbi:MAG: pilus assembly protein PilM [Planctomycetes bacterium]|nr:pilus assembly protein PilM [Planctomycetota bacterium]